MLTGQNRFNIYLTVALTAAFVPGCQTTTSSRKKEVSTLRLHLETNPVETAGNLAVPVYRANPVMVCIEKMPFLEERNVAEAKIVDALGGFAIQIQFDHEGTWLLEQYSTARKGRRYAIFSQFGDTAAEARWLAAPLVAQRITNGMLVFTPDATHEEAERIVRGLNNVANVTKKKSNEPSR